MPSAVARRRAQDHRSRGLAVAPGFIDIKTHSDFTLPINPKAESKVRQGVTTEIVGHCGFSVAPALPGKVELLKDYLSPSAPWLPFRETSFPDYLASFPPTAVNAGMLVGHNTLRLMVMGMAERAPSAAELAPMIALLEDALDAGAFGLSSGLFTPPGSYAAARRNDRARPCAQAAQRRLFHAPSRRIQQGASRPSPRRSTIAEQCGVHVEIVHFKCSGIDNWGKAATALAMIAERQGARGRRRLRFLPLRGRLEPAEEHLAAMGAGRRRRGDAGAARRRQTREQIRADIARDGLNNWGRIPSWDCVQISISPHLPQHSGRTIAALAAERGPIRSTRYAIIWSRIKARRACW